MINVICLITVTIMLHGVTTIHPWMQQKQVHGHIVDEADDVYLIDFSKEAKEKGFIGNYQDLMIQKIMCRKLVK
jgi:hypothetical protein